MWSDQMIPMVRALISDLSDSPTYSDTRLEELLCAAALLTKMDVDFPVNYTINLATTAISPDPSSDENVIGLVSLRAACLITRGDAIVAAGKAASVRDGPWSIDLRNTSSEKRILADTLQAQYDSLSADYQRGNNIPGTAIVGPHNFSGNQSSTIFESDGVSNRPDFNSR